MIGHHPDRIAYRLPLRVRVVPIASTLAGSAMAMLPIVSTAPVLPPLGLLMLLGWRLLRPEMLAAWIALPLGLADDLFSGNFLGTSMALWTVTLLLLEWIDSHFVWRDYWMEWVIAAGVIVAVTLASWLVSQPVHSHARLLVVVPQIVLAVLIFPAMLRLTAALDHWRLRR